MKIIGYIGIFNDVVVSEAYHGFGWTRATKGQLEMMGYHVDILDSDSDLSLYTELYIDEGVNFQDNKWNKIGGDFTKVEKKLTALNQWTGTIKYNSLRGFPTYTDLIEKRKLKSTLDLSPPKIFIEPIVFADQTTKMVIGDSHATSVWEPNYALLSINGKTQHSYIGDGIINHIKPHIRTLRFYAGNIDIRFHIHRLNIDVKQYVKNLFLQLIELRKMGIIVELVQPLPIEDESRKLPLTGQYKGANFYGTCEERMAIRLEIDRLYRHLCEKWGIIYITWPKHYQEISGRLSFSYMEPKSSVHLSPKHYKYKKNIFNNEHI
jgi:hypothetical protein